MGKSMCVHGARKPRKKTLDIRFDIVYIAVVTAWPGLAGHGMAGLGMAGRGMARVVTVLGSGRSTLPTYFFDGGCEMKMQFSVADDVIFLGTSGEFGEFDDMVEYIEDHWNYTSRVAENKYEIVTYGFCDGSGVIVGVYKDGEQIFCAVDDVSDSRAYSTVLDDIAGAIILAEEAKFDAYGNLRGERIAA